jgi:dTDP-4-dehydrorhamnose reductase
MRSALIVGGDGLIARALVAQLMLEKWAVNCTSRRNHLPDCWIRFDLRDGVSVLPGALLKNVDVVFICAAITGFAACTSDPQGSRYINVTRTVELGRHFMKNGAQVVYLSSNAVFDGTRAALNEYSPITPVTEYGQQKADCEAMLLCAASELSGKCAVVRLTKVVDRKQPLYSGWMQNLSAQLPIKAAVDLRISPITTAFVARGLSCIGAGGQSGVYHLSGEQDVTYLDLASAMIAALGKCVSVEHDWIQKRLVAVPSPAHSTLSMMHTTDIFGLKPQPLEAVVRELIDQY